MRIIDATALSCFARKTAESASDFASAVHNLIMDVRDSYRPELHYMRGPGPKWRAKHQPWLKLRFSSLTAGRTAPAVATVWRPSRRGQPHLIARPRLRNHARPEGRIRRVHPHLRSKLCSGGNPRLDAAHWCRSLHRLGSYVERCGACRRCPRRTQIADEV